MDSAYLYGAGGHAKVISDILKSNNTFVVEIFDDNLEIDSLLDIPVVHDLVKSPLIISIGNNSIRKKVKDKLIDVSYISALSNTATISSTVVIGLGSVVMQGVIIQASATIGEHVIINTGATIDHDCVVHDFVHIAPGSTICGNVEIGEGTFIGAGTIIIQGVKIGKWSVIGAGTVITQDIPDNVLAVGVPCKIKKYIENNE
ncbi:MAG: hypothetical protein RL662_2029 [Bacteroidota bacterium]|jgi:sugar O-acyltransferase (sialic acid O-acetyltransferase NeuD family)